MASSRKEYAEKIGSQMTVDEFYKMQIADVYISFVGENRRIWVDDIEPDSEETYVISGDMDISGIDGQDEIIYLGAT